MNIKNESPEQQLRAKIKLRAINSMKNLLLNRQKVKSFVRIYPLNGGENG
jgi:hypothetical protein